MDPVAYFITNNHSKTMAPGQPPGLPGLSCRAFQDVRIDGEKVTAFQVRNPRCCKSLGAEVWWSFKNLGRSYPFIFSAIYIGVVIYLHLLGIPGYQN